MPRTSMLTSQILKAWQSNDNPKNVLSKKYKLSDNANFRYPDTNLDIQILGGLVWSSCRIKKRGSKVRPGNI
jgi:hypothetical protein